MVGRWVGARRRVGGGLSAGAAVRPFALGRMSGRPSGVVIMNPAVPGAMGGAAAMWETLQLDPAGRGIVSSGYSSDPVMANFRDCGFRASVPKPDRLADFAPTLRNVMAEDWAGGKMRGGRPRGLRWSGGATS